MITTTFSMPTDSSAADRLGAVLVTQLCDLPAQWLHGDSQSTFLYLTYPEHRAATVEHLVLRAHPRIVLRHSAPSSAPEVRDVRAARTLEA